uniref:Transthyretin-like family protein n=1 Tax=Panagrellus redivivus TaxID=6233 RepID=A0A7E4UQ67_PANRE
MRFATATLLVFGLLLPMVASDKFYRVRGNFLCHKKPITGEPMTATITEVGTFQNEIKKFEFKNGRFDFLVHMDGWFKKGDVTLEIPFICGDCEGVYEKTIRTNKQFDTPEEAHTHPSAYYNIALEKRCKK